MTDRNRCEAAIQGDGTKVSKGSAVIVRAAYKQTFDSQSALEVFDTHRRPRCHCKG